MQVDQKKYEPIDISYLELASTKTELNDGMKVAMPGLTLCNKDFFVIQTNVCSTKLTQNGTYKRSADVETSKNCVY